MGTVLLSNEDIRKLIPKEAPPEEKFPMYHSKFSKKVREEVKKVKDCHRTMGYAEVQLDPPNKFLKKKTRVVRRPCIEKYKLDIPPKPSIHPREYSIPQKKEEKNFRKENIMKAIRSVPKHPVLQVADTKTGHTQLLEQSGLQPKYIYKKEFGKIPKYLENRHLRAEEKEKRIRQKEAQKKPPLRYITEDERLEMLEGLRKNWEELQKEFQLLPMVMDTVPKIKRKLKLEKELKDLEKDIALLEKNSCIYVEDMQDEEHEKENTKKSNEKEEK